MEIILNTQTSSFYQRWQYKLAYTQHVMKTPTEIGSTLHVMLHTVLLKEKTIV